MERMVRGRRIHGVDISVRSPTRHGHYTLSRPEFEDRRSLESDSDSDRLFGNGDKGYSGQSMQSRRLSEFNEGFPRGKPTSSKFEWEQLLAQSKILGSAESYGITATTMTTERTYYGGRVSNSSQFGTTLLDKPVSMGPESGRLSSPCHLDVGVPRSSGNEYGCSFVLPSRHMTSGHQMDEHFWIRNQAHLVKPSQGQVFEKQDNLEVYFKDASVHTKPDSKLQEFRVGLQKDAFHGSFSKGLHFPSYGSGLSPELVAIPIGLHGLGVKSIESHVDPHSMRSNDRSNPPVYPPCIPSSDGRSNPLVDPRRMQSSDMRSNPHGDFSSNEGKLVDYTSMEDQKRLRGNMGKMSDKFYGNMASFGEEYADPDFSRANVGDRIVDRIDECSPRAHLKNTRPGDHVSPSIDKLNMCYVPASGSLHSKGQEREVTGYRSTLIKYKDAYEKSGCLLSVDEHGLKRDRSEMLEVTDHDSCLDGVDGSFELQLEREKLEMLPVRNSDTCLDGVDGRFEKRLSPGDSLGNILKRKDGVADEQHLFVSKKLRCNLPQDENAGKSSNETACHRTINSDNHVSKLDKSSGIYSRDINKCLGTNHNIIVTSSSLNEQKLSVEKRLGHSPQNIRATHSSVNKQKHSVKKQLGPAPKKVKLCPQGLQNQNAGNFTQRIQDGADGADGQEGVCSKGNVILAKTEKPHVPPPQVKNQIPGEFTKRTQDGPDGAHSQEGDSLKCNTTPAKSEPPHVPLPQVKNQIPNKFTKSIRDGLDGAPSKEGNSSKGNATPAKTEPPHVPPPQVKIQKAGKFTKRIRDGSHGAHSQEGDSTKGNAAHAKTKPRASQGAKKKNAGKFTKGRGDAPHGVHGDMDDSSKGKVTPAMSERVHVASLVVKIQKSGELNRAPDGAYDQKGDCLKGKVTRVRTEPPENSKDFKQWVHRAFQKFVKHLNENSAHWRNFLEQGKAGRLKCTICGSKSEEFVDMESLALHTFTSPTVEYRSLHLGFHKALCLMMGWKSAMAFDSSWICETLPDAEASALKEDFIIWPPVAVIHNSSTQNNNPDERVVVTSEMLEAVLKDKGFGEKIKVGRGRPGNQSIMVVKFSGTLSGLQEAERLHSFYAETKHGRSEFQRVMDSKSSTTWESSPPAFKLENVLYGYLGVAEDLDKLDFETKKRCLVKSKQEIQSIADAF